MSKAFVIHAIKNSIKMKTKIPKYLKNKELWKLRAIFILVPTIFSYIAGIWEFSVVWFFCITFLLLFFDTYKTIINYKTETFK